MAIVKFVSDKTCRIFIDKVFSGEVNKDSILKLTLESGGYLVEVKDRTKLNDPIVLAKKERAISYCKVASEYNMANGHKPFKYLFVPDDEITASSSFNNIKDRFASE